MYFGRAKVHKAPGIRKKQSFAPFAYELRCNIIRPSQTCHSNPICLEQGVAKLVPHGCIRKITPMLHSNILTQWPAQDRDLRCVFIDAGFVLTLPFTGNSQNNTGTVKNIVKARFCSGVSEEMFKVR